MRRLVVVGSMTAGALAGVVAARGRRVEHVAAREARFDPDAVARLEVAGWRAYYDRNSLKGAVILLRLMRGQFGTAPLDTLRASYYALRGQMVFSGERGDRRRALAWMERFYSVAPRRAGVTAEQLAAAELDYWVEHRRLVREDDKTALIDALARLHALLFGGTAEEQRPSAKQRTLACNAVDRITGHTSTDPAHDWSLAEEYLRRAYRLAAMRDAWRAPSPDPSRRGGEIGFNC